MTDSSGWDAEGEGYWHCPGKRCVWCNHEDSLYTTGCAEDMLPTTARANQIGLWRVLLWKLESRTLCKLNFNTWREWVPTSTIFFLFLGIGRTHHQNIAVYYKPQTPYYMKKLRNTCTLVCLLYPHVCGLVCVLVRWHVSLLGRGSLLECACMHCMELFR